MIIFGAVIASGINDTGAATSMVNFFIKKFKGKCLELAPALTGFIMSIPVFGDIAIILNAPISAILAKRKKLGMQQVAPFVNLGLTLTHGLVPPTPGILAVAILLGADIGTVIIIGLICSVISFAVCYLGLRPVYAKGEYVAPLPQYTEGIEAVEDTNDVNALLIKEDNTPSSGASFLPLLLPAVMIAIGSIGKLFSAEGSAAYNFFNTFGNTVLALFMGIIAVGCLIFGRKDKVVKKANADGTGCKLTEKSSWFEIVMNNWVGRALQIAIGALLITAMGGAHGRHPPRERSHCHHRRHDRREQLPRRSGALYHGSHPHDRLRFHDHRRHDCCRSDGRPDDRSGPRPRPDHSGHRRPAPWSAGTSTTAASGSSPPCTALTPSRA